MTLQVKDRVGGGRALRGCQPHSLGESQARGQSQFLRCFRKDRRLGGGVGGRPFSGERMFPNAGKALLGLILTGPAASLPCLTTVSAFLLKREGGCQGQLLSEVLPTQPHQPCPASAPELRAVNPRGAEGDSTIAAAAKGDSTIAAAPSFDHHNGRPSPRECPEPCAAQEW